MFIIIETPPGLLYVRPDQVGMTLDELTMPVLPQPRRDELRIRLRFAATCLNMRIPEGRTC